MVLLRLVTTLSLMVFTGFTEGSVGIGGVVGHGRSLMLCQFFIVVLLWGEDVPMHGLLAAVDDTGAGALAGRVVASSSCSRSRHPTKGSSSIRRRDEEARTENVAVAHGVLGKKTWGAASCDFK